MSKREILDLINNYTVNQRLELIQSILSGIQGKHPTSIIDHSKQSTGKDLKEFAGLWDEETANDFHKSLEDCRKINLNEW